MSKGTILIVDDEYSFAQFAKMIFKRLGYDAETVLDGRRCVETAAKLAPTMILMDMNLKVISGTEIIRSLKQDVRTKHIPILLCSITCARSEIQEALAAGAADYIPKPLKPDTLQLALDKILEDQ